jgi:hypothetical protein
MNPHLNYLIAQERTADLMRSSEQGRLARHARTVEPNHARLGLSARLFARLRTCVATSATAAPVEDHAADPAISPKAGVRSSLGRR